MRRWMALSLLAVVVTSTAFAQDARLKRLENGVEAAAWEAVGRLNIGGTGFCTGALIAPDMVLTAAHCLFDKASGARIDHSTIEFLAGWRNGRASAYRYVRRALVHPDYDFGADVTWAWCAMIWLCLSLTTRSGTEKYCHSIPPPARAGARKWVL